VVKFAGADFIGLRSFLTSQSFLTEDLRNFINGTSDDELRQRLLMRIEWDTGAHELPYDVLEADKIFVNVGERASIP
jgi:hypothetical protein